MGLRVPGAGGSEQHIQCVFELSWEADRALASTAVAFGRLFQVSTKLVEKGGGAKKEFYVFA